jgi:transposase InsO family protein
MLWRSRNRQTVLAAKARAVVPANILDRKFQGEAPNRKWVADFTYVWTAEGWLYVAVVIDLFSRRLVGWSMGATMAALPDAKARSEVRRRDYNERRPRTSLGWLTRPNRLPPRLQRRPYERRILTLNLEEKPGDPQPALQRALAYAI